MPTYEYECKTCGHRFEKFQSITAAPIKTCPKCKKSVRRLIHGGAGIIFKGSGPPAPAAKPCPSSGSKPECSSCPGKAE